ncbi:hypothetical protein [Psychromicrobium sp. YIM B11713]
MNTSQDYELLAQNSGKLLNTSGRRIRLEHKALTQRIMNQHDTG